MIYSCMKHKDRQSLMMTWAMIMMRKGDGTSWTDVGQKQSSEMDVAVRKHS